jgi:hypothetical protein
VAEALSSALRSGVAPDGSQLGPFRPILGRLLPEWRGDDQALLDDAEVAVAEAVLRFLRACAREQGVVVILEDLHWADPETLTLVEYVTDNAVSERVLCVVTVRDDDRSSGTELVRSVQARRTSRVLELAPLDQRQVAAMVASCLGGEAVPEEVVAIAARADGVPFMVEELLAAALASGALVAKGGSWRVIDSVEAMVPLTLADSMRRRLRDLGEHGRRVLVAAAVLGRRFDWSLVPPMTGLGDDEVLGGFHDAVAAQIVAFDRDHGSFRFRHALSRDAVLAGLFPPELEALSRRALEAVRSRHPILEEGWAELAAELATGAGDQPLRVPAGGAGQRRSEPGTGRRPAARRRSGSPRGRRVPPGRRVARRQAGARRRGGLRVVGPARRRGGVGQSAGGGPPPACPSRGGCHQVG